MATKLFSILKEIAKDSNIMPNPKLEKHIFTDYMSYQEKGDK